jgi:hypothetical protein
MHLDLLRSAHCARYGNLLLARVDQPKAAPTGEHVARLVKHCNAPATQFPVGISHTIEPGPLTAEVAFCHRAMIARGISEAEKIGDDVMRKIIRTSAPEARPKSASVILKRIMMPRLG